VTRKKQANQETTPRSFCYSVITKAHTGPSTGADILARDINLPLDDELRSGFTYFESLCRPMVRLKRPQQPIRVAGPFDPDVAALLQHTGATSHGTISHTGLSCCSPGSLIESHSPSSPSTCSAPGLAPAENRSSARPDASAPPPAGVGAASAAGALLAPQLRRPRPSLAATRTPCHLWTLVIETRL
jgi:hypothetical protein